MNRLIEKTVFWGLVTAWRLAIVPTSRSPDAVNATTDGVVLPPSAFSMTVGSPPSSTAMHELVVPRSIPIVLAIVVVAPSLLRNKSESQYRRFISWGQGAGERLPPARPRPPRSPDASARGAGVALVPGAARAQVTPVGPV